MGQAEILDLLESKFKADPERYFTRREIAEMMGKEPKIITCPLRSLRRYGEVETRSRGSPPNGGPDTLEYRYKK